MKKKKFIKIDPFNRVEGDLEIKLEIKDGKVVDAYSSGVAFRGFEKLLLRREPMDALVFTCRVCGICSISHSAASSLALKNAYNAEMPINAYLIRNITLASEIVISHLTHFYCFLLIDFTNRKYEQRKDFQDIVRRFAFLRGNSYLRALKARQDFLALLGLFIGKWPNTLALHPGGMTKAINASEIARGQGVLLELRNFIENVLLGSDIESFLANETVEDLNQWFAKTGRNESDLRLYERLARENGFMDLGRGPEKFVCTKAFGSADGTALYRGGYFNTKHKNFQQDKISESIGFSYFEGYKNGRHPITGITEPDASKKNAYSWVKAPRYDDQVVEVGPLARLVINRFPLLVDLAKNSGVNVYTRTFARIYEMVLLVGKIEEWLNQLDPEEPFYNPFTKIDETEGIGLVEAARGMLGHWVIIEHGKIKLYQIITPTAWNMSPRDDQGRLGAAEQALLGTPIEDEKNPIEIGHVIRSFDPCLFCSTHTLDGEKIL